MEETCKNCTKALPEGAAWCPHCGAKVVRERLSLPSIGQDLSETLFNWDNAIFRTIGDLALRPEKLIGAYLAGVRKRYVHPLRYLLLMGVLSGLFLSKSIEHYAAWSELVNNWISQQIPDGGRELASETGQDISKQIGSFIYRYYTQVLLLGVPVYASIAKFVFRRSGYNMAEHLAINAYLAGQYTLYGALVQLLLLPFGQLAAWALLAQTATTFGYLLFGWRQVYAGGRNWPIIKALGRLLLIFLAYILFSGLVGVAIGLIMRYNEG